MKSILSLILLSFIGPLTLLAQPPQQLSIRTVPRKFFGTAAPGNVPTNLPGDFFTDTMNHNQYVCNATPTTPAPACTSVTTNGWLLITGVGGGGGGGGTSSYSATVTAQTSVSITAVTHGQGTLALSYCFDNATPPLAVRCAYTRNTSGDMVFTFNPAFTGSVEIVSSTTNYTATVTAQTSVSVTAAAHGKGISAVAYCFDNATPALAVSCSYTRSVIGDIVFTFNPAFTGQIQIR